MDCQERFLGDGTVTNDTSGYNFVGEGDASRSAAECLSEGSHASGVARAGAGTPGGALRHLGNTP